MEPNETGTTNPTQSGLAKNATPKLKKRLLIVLATALAVLGSFLAYWYTQREPVVTEQLTTYDDQVISFEYPSTWTVKKINDLDSPGGYLVVIESNLIDDTFEGSRPTDKLKTKLQLTTNFWVKKKGALVPTCYSCTIQDVPSSRQMAFDKPIGHFEPVFGNNSAVAGSPVIMSINSAKLESGTKDYKASVNLPNGSIAVIKAQIKYQVADTMVALTNAQDFYNSPAYQRLERLIATVEIK